MFRRIIEKLKSRSGASVVLALFLVIVCSFAGTAALTSARANVGRGDGKRDTQRQYLSVSSAARLIIDDLVKNGDEVKISVDSSTDTATLTGDFPSDSDNSIYALMKKEIADSAKYALKNESHTENIDFEIDAGDPAFENVKVSLAFKYPQDTGSGDINGNMVYIVSCGEYSFKFEVGLEYTIDKSSGSDEVTIEPKSGAILPAQGGDGE